MKKLILVILLVLAGCNLEGADDNEARKPSGLPDIEPFMVTDAGITIYWESKIDPATINNESTFDDENLKLYTNNKEFIDHRWNELQACLGLGAQPPIIRIVDDVQDVCPNVSEDGQAAYCRSLEPAPVVLDVKKAFPDDGDVEADLRTWLHEWTHHILENNGILEHRGHEPDHLWECENMYN